jgi:hypothetical protein
VGYNPYRKHRVRPGDFVMVAAVTMVGAGLLAWGLFS